MKLSTDNCGKYIAEWVAQNSDQVPVTTITVDGIKYVAK